MAPTLVTFVACVAYVLWCCVCCFCVGWLALLLVAAVGGVIVIAYGVRQGVEWRWRWLSVLGLCSSRTDLMGMMHGDGGMLILRTVRYGIWFVGSAWCVWCTVLVCLVVVGWAGWLAGYGG